MKGIVVGCLEELVRKRFGDDAWASILGDAGIDPATAFADGENLPDAIALELFAKTCETRSLTFEQACSAFGDHWVGEFMPRKYPEFFRGIASTREFLTRLDAVHGSMAGRLPGSLPPRHSYEWEDESTLLMSYQSYRGIFDLFVATVEATARHFGDDIEVSKLEGSRVRIVFH